MSRVLPYLLGPELYWTCVCLFVHFAGRTGRPPEEAYCSTLDDHWAWLPFVFVPLTFVCFFVPGVSRWWLLLRVDAAIVVGITIAAWSFSNAMTYHKPSAGPGAGTAFMVIPMLGIFIAAVATLVTAIVLWWRSRGAA